MAGMKSLAKDTAIYGLSSILGRFLNWCFVFLYINVLKTTAEYGIVTNLYAYMALSPPYRWQTEKNRSPCHKSG